MRPYNTEWALPNGVKYFEPHEVNILEVLTELKFTQSKAEARRIVEQNIIWIDDLADPPEESRIWDRIKKVQLRSGKFLSVERDDIICVGKTVDEAICHRIYIK